MGTTNVPIPVFGPNGFAAPSASGIVGGVMADINQAFGGNMATDPAEPQGQLGTSFAACVQFFQDLFLAYVNGVDPASSSGRMQDALGRLTAGFERIAAESTTTTATCVGAAYTPIPQGSLAKTQGGDIYAAVNGGTIPITGSIDLEFANVVTGAVPCPAGYLDTIYQAIPGWDTIVNVAAGAEGHDVESPTAFEGRRQASVAANSVGTNDAIKGNILKTVAGVIDAYAIDNASNTAQTIGGVSIAANSLFVCVYGGTPADVAFAIWQKKNGGCSYTGTTTVAVQDTSNGYVSPFPTYEVSFTYATPLPTTVKVVLASNSQVPSDAVTEVQQAVLSAFAGTDATGLGRPKIGANLFGNRFYAPIAALGPWAQIISITVGTANDPDAAQFTGSITSNSLVATAVTGVLATGQTVGGALPDTVITGQVSGPTGGAGTYTVSNPQTLASGPLSAYAPDQAYSPVHINQIPVISQTDIAVAFV